FSEIFALRGFQDLWNFAQTAVAHDEAEGVESDFALADVFMSIHSRAARRFGIVDMNRNETIETDYAVELAKCFSNCCFTANVITGGEDRCGVEINDQTTRL